MRAAKTLQLVTEQLAGGCELSDADAMLDALAEAESEESVTAFLTAWNRKGVTENELFATAAAMRSRCVRVNPNIDGLVDIVGTGGSPAKTFNVSTAAAFVVAGAGVPVAKHGNRAATSHSGSVDVLEKLAVNIDMSAEAAARCLETVGICFMNARNFHSLSPTLAAARRRIGKPTIFNMLGPLCNPANISHSLIGVWNADLVVKVANALARIGTKRSWVVNGYDELDEVSLSGRTHIGEIADGRRVTAKTIEPADFGIAAAADDGIRITTADESARLIRKVIGGEAAGNVSERIVLINAAAALALVTGESLPDAYQRAAESIASGRARKTLNDLAEFDKRR